jgi:hypothetical protein
MEAHPHVMRRQTNTSTIIFFMAFLLGPLMTAEFGVMDDWVVACTPAVEKSIRSEQVD